MLARTRSDISSGHLLEGPPTAVSKSPFVFRARSCIHCRIYQPHIFVGKHFCYIFPGCRIFVRIEGGSNAGKFLVVAQWESKGGPFCDSSNVTSLHPGGRNESRYELHDPSPPYSSHVSFSKDCLVLPPYSLMPCQNIYVELASEWFGRIGVLYGWQWFI